MNRVLVLGSSGSGKSTVARRLGELLDVEVIHLDSHYWQPHWTDTPAEEWDRKLKDLLQKERWVMDGNYTRSLPLRMEVADTIVFLDYHRLVCLWRCLGRFLRYRGSNRPELAPGCYEKLDWEFLKWIWNYPRDARPKVLDALESRGGEKRIFRLGNDKEVTAFLGEMAGASPAV